MIYILISNTFILKFTKNETDQKQPHFGRSRTAKIIITCLSVVVFLELLGNILQTSQRGILLCTKSYSNDY